MEKKKDSELLKILMLAVCILLIIASVFIKKKRNNLNEAKNLPFFNTQLETVKDGVYENSTYTSFLHVKLTVTVQNHIIKDITILENKGSYGQKVSPITDKMIEQNKVVVPLIEKEEIASLVFISCVDGALHKGIE